MKFYVVVYAVDSTERNHYCVVRAKNVYGAICAFQSAEFSRDFFIVDVVEIEHFLNCEVVAK